MSTWLLNDPLPEFHVRFLKKFVNKKMERRFDLRYLYQRSHFIIHSFRLFLSSGATQHEFLPPFLIQNTCWFADLLLILNFSLFALFCKQSKKYFKCDCNFDADFIEMKFLKGSVISSVPLLIYHNCQASKKYMRLVWLPLDN